MDHSRNPSAQGYVQMGSPTMGSPQMQQQQMMPGSPMMAQQQMMPMVPASPNMYNQQQFPQQMYQPQPQYPVYQQQPMYQQPMMQQQQQPQSPSIIINTTQTTTSGGNETKSRQPSHQPPRRKEPRPWHFGLFGCLEDPLTCALSVCFPCVVFGQNTEKITGTSFFTPCCMYTCVTLCTFGVLLPFYTFGTRGSLRSKYHINGDACADLMIHCCCHWCALTQESREINWIQTVQAEEEEFNN
ncbi:PLAC8 family-domain-containing protein [Obelidium mucronatum]|nr:PLAC8 family-domain-containing protein [Obelidium mucronatum]